MDKIFPTPFLILLICDVLGPRNKPPAHVSKCSVEKYPHYRAVLVLLSNNKCVSIRYFNTLMVHGKILKRVALQLST